MGNISFLRKWVIGWSVSLSLVNKLMLKSKLLVGIRVAYVRKVDAKSNLKTFG
jgi:hypothetical protein